MPARVPPRLRNACETDAPVLSALALRSKASWGYSQEFMDACREELTFSATDIRDGHFVVAECKGTVVGFVAVDHLNAEAVELDALFVEPTAQGRGVGRALLECAKDTGVRLGASTMIIQADPNAMGFYRAMHGQQVGARESASIRGRLLPLLLIDLNNDDERRSQNLGR